MGKAKGYTIDSFGWFPCKDVHEFMKLRKSAIKVTTIKWVAVGVDLSYAEYWIKKTPIILFLN